MTESTSDVSPQQAQQLLNIGAALGELTQAPDQLPRIPVYLASALGIDRLTIALVRDTPVGPEVVLSYSSGDFAKTAPRFAEEILTLYFRTRPVSESPHGPVFRSDPSLAALAAPAGTSTGPAAVFPNASVFARDMSRGLRMLVIVHQSQELAPLTRELSQSLESVADLLAKLLGCAAAWMFQPETLGAPFDTLTQREWAVLRGLQSGAPEKQLADQLQMSRHTLHSHVKSIYRKVGVPGRLLLLLRVQHVLHDLRIAKLENRQSEATTKVLQNSTLTV